MKTALHATRSRSTFRPARPSPRLIVSCTGLVVAHSPMSPAISATQEAPPIVGVIDSDPVARAALKTMLQPVGVEVMSFDTAESYLLSGATRNLACLIVDLLLPGMSGLELLRRLRSNGNDVPVILLADESDVPTAVAAMREGATDFIEKPYVNVAILKQVQKLIRGQSGGDVMPA
jgi:two-component system, chemotaxis family, CheB/CheR fusion protein